MRPSDFRALPGDTGRMSTEKCRVTTLAGRPCGWDVARCPVPAHRQQREEFAAQGPTDAGPEPAPVAPPAEVEARDLVGLGWWLVERVISGATNTAEASVLASVMRVLAALGPGEMDRDAALREAQLRGLVMHGIPPRTAEEWELAESLFDDDALAELRRWQALLEADSDDHREPLLFRHRTGHKRDTSLGVDGEDGL